MQEEAQLHGLTKLEGREGQQWHPIECELNLLFLRAKSSTLATVCKEPIDTTHLKNTE